MPVFGNLLGGLVLSLFICRQPDEREPLWRIRRRIAQWRQLAHRHQNLNVMLREAQQVPLSPQHLIPRWFDTLEPPPISGTFGTPTLNRTGITHLGNAGSIHLSYGGL